MESLSTETPAASAGERSLDGAQIVIVGKLAGMSRRSTQQLLRDRGATLLDAPTDAVQTVVLGEAELPLSPSDGDSQFGEALRQSIDEGRVEVITESQLWQRLGLVDFDQDVKRLYTPAMLAELLHVPVAVVRRWHRRGLIVPTREVRRLPYFDFREVATARRLAELLAAGMSPQTIERKLAELARYVPSVRRPLAQLSVIVEGKNLLLRQGDGLVAPGGQLWFDFQPPQPGQSDSYGHAPDAASESSTQSSATLPFEQPVRQADELSVSAILATAASLEDDGELAAAADMYRAALAAGGPNPAICFSLAELLYRLGDITAARERYFITIELDEEYVEARANLGCVLAELGEYELAVAAFEGALSFHDEYPDVHYHLAHTLDDLARPQEAELHWRTFLALAPESPWAAAARRRLGGDNDSLSRAGPD